jgi:hypothetical protein
MRAMNDQQGMSGGKIHTAAAGHCSQQRFI